MSGPDATSSENIDPSEFVQRIRELGEKRDQEDAERFRQLEEEIFQGRSERLARRAERARSLSPEKASVSGTPPSLRSHGNTPTRETSVNSPVSMNSSASRSGAPASGGVEDSLQRLTSKDGPAESATEPSQSPADEGEQRASRASQKSPNPSVSPSRSGTLSWQRRPTSSSSATGGRRPLSMVAAENAARSPLATPEATGGEGQPELTRGQIAQSLSSKDPNWFKQTADRGAGSAAYRKGQEDNVSDSASTFVGGRRQLPGMMSSRESTAETESHSLPGSPPPDSVRSSSPSRGSSIRGSAAWSNRFSSATSMSGQSNFEGRSPIPSLDAQKFPPPTSDQTSATNGGDHATPTGRNPAMSPAQGRISPERPVSPTKGMGGFVQSAMLRRSESASKRWSATQPSTGLSRQSSTASNRSGFGYDRAPGSTSPTKFDSRPSSLSRENSMEPSGSRPSSSHSSSTVTQDFSKRTTEPAGANAASNDGFVKPALPRHNRMKSVTAPYASNDQSEEGKPSEVSPPSPPKRWSPTKASWLESALNKPESPKPKMAPPSQPSWMADLAKAKQQRASVDEGRSPAKTDAMSRPVSVFSGSKSPEADEPSHPNTVAVPKEEIEPKSAPPLKTKPLELGSTPTKEAQTAVSDSIRSPPLQSASPPAMKAKPVTPPKKDFRSSLRSRDNPPTHKQSTSQGGEPEFKNVFGKLKRTQTEKYVAPDELKTNILGGKAALKMTGGPQKNELRNEFKESLIEQKKHMNITGGPKKTERRDELKESLIEQKLAMKAKAEESGTVLGEAKKAKEVEEKPLPEALARRSGLSRAEMLSTTQKDTKTGESTTPEALSRFKSMGHKSKPSVPEKPEKKRSIESPGRLADELRPDEPVLASIKSPERPPSNEPTPTSAKAVEMPRAAEPTPISGKPFGTRRSDNPTLRSTMPVETPRKQQPTLDSRKPVWTPRSTQSPGIASKSDEQQDTTPKPATGKLADRFNPALANILARGPPIMGPSDKPATASPARSATLPESGKSDSASGAELTHMTKGRARGPKRRAPATKSAPGSVSSSTLEKPKASPVQNVPLVKPQDVLPSVGTPLAEKPKADADARFDMKPESAKSKPLAPAKSPQLAEKPSKPVDESAPARFTESPKPAPIVVDKSSLPTPQKKENITSLPPSSRPLPSPPKTNAAASPFRAGFGGTKSPSIEQTQTDEPESISLKSASAFWSRQSTPSPTMSRSKSPIKLPTRKDEEKAMEDAGLIKTSETPPRSAGLGLDLGDPVGRASPMVERQVRGISPTSRDITSPLSSKLPPTPGRKPVRAPSPQSDLSQLPVPQHSPEPTRKPMSETARVLAERFGAVPSLPEALSVDTAALIASNPFPSKPTKTVRKSVRELSADSGKLLPVPAHEEHILYSAEMYLCAHTFSDESGKQQTDVYFWVGSEVSEAAVEDAQLFARRGAKELGGSGGGKPVLLHQGKEPPAFFQALGGIVITRSGARPSSSSADSSSHKYMLCGRRHLGHIAFDEVPFALSSLCAGFPFLVCGDGRLYLWRGVGCTQDEFSAALLIGSSDLASATGMPPEPIDEGKEPAAFLALFPAPPAGVEKKVPRSADHWRHKPKCGERYRTRLFRVDAGGPNAARSHERSASSLSSSPLAQLGAGFQVSSFWPKLLARRPSWNSLGGGTQQQTPISPQPSSSPQHQHNMPSPPAPLPLSEGAAEPTRDSLSPQKPSPTTPRRGDADDSAAAAVGVTEIAPFRQADLAPEGVFVLDAFFEVYILPGPLSAPAALAHALLLAQDYAILAASLEDRPAVPVASLVLDGAPRDLRAVFRAWDDARVDTAALMAGRPNGEAWLGGKLKVVGLAAVVGACREEGGRS